MVLFNGCDFGFQEVPAKRAIVIEEVKIYGNDELSDYRGKPIEFTLAEKPQRRTVTYTIKILTDTGFEARGHGFIVSAGFYYDQTNKILENMYLWVPRHDGTEIRRIISEEVNPGNINIVEIRLFENKKEIAQFNFKNL